MATDRLRPRFGRHWCALATPLNRSARPWENFPDPALLAPSWPRGRRNEPACVLPPGGSVRAFRVP